MRLESCASCRRPAALYSEKLKRVFCAMCFPFGWDTKAAPPFPFSAITVVGKLRKRGWL